MVSKRRDLFENVSKMFKIWIWILQLPFSLGSECGQPQQRWLLPWHFLAIPRWVRHLISITTRWITTSGTPKPVTGGLHGGTVDGGLQDHKWHYLTRLQHQSEIPHSIMTPQQVIAAGVLQIGGKESPWTTSGQGSLTFYLQTFQAYPRGSLIWKLSQFLGYANVSSKAVYLTQ